MSIVQSNYYIWRFVYWITKKFSFFVYKKTLWFHRIYVQKKKQNILNSIRNNTYFLFISFNNKIDPSNMKIQSTIPSTPDRPNLITKPIKNKLNLGQTFCLEPPGSRVRIPRSSFHFHRLSNRATRRSAIVCPSVRFLWEAPRDRRPTDPT